METLELNCIKCSAKYKTNDPDPYLCVPCNDERLALAKKIDAQMSGRVSKRGGMSDLQVFESEAKTITMPNGRTVSFAPAKLS